MSTMDASIYLPTLQIAFQRLQHRKLFNLEIKSCNALKSVPFTKADVLLQQIHDMECKDDPYYPVIPKARKYLGITYRELFRYEIFDAILEQGLESIHPEHKDAFQLLLGFLENIKFHETAINDVKRSGVDKDSLCAVLGQHLFSQLTPGKKFVVDETASKRVSRCPCHQRECGEKIEAGCTAIGSDSAWHGNADIFLDQKIPVVVPDVQDVIQDETQSAKKMKTASLSDSEEETTDEQDNICVEVENKSKPEALLNLYHLDQMIAEVITNGFAQVNRDPSLSGWLIPTFGCTADHVVVFLYDSVHDVLLQTVTLTPLWSSQDVLNIDAIVEIWMYLNFPLFSNPDLAVEFEFVKSRFHECASEKLVYYRQAVCCQNIKSVDTNYYANIVMPRVHDMIKLPKKRKKKSDHQRN